MNKYVLSVIIIICYHIAIAKSPSSISPQILYAGNYSDNTISAYTINPDTGQLTPLDIGEVRTVNFPADIASFENKTLYVLGWDDSKIYTYSIEKDGRLNLTSTSTSVQPGPWGMYAHPNKKNMYVSNFYANSISMFDVEQTNGSLTSMLPNSTSAGTGVCGMAFYSKYLYAVNYSENNILMYEIESTSGALKKLNVTFKAGVLPRSIRIVNSHAYVTNYSDETINMFNIEESSGKLVPMNPPTIRSGLGLIGSRISKSGQYFYVASYSEGMIYMYKIEPNGLLQPLSPVKVKAGVGPRGFVEDRYGHIYVSNMLSNSFSLYQIESNTGVLQPLNPSTLQRNKQALALAIVDMDT